jgi:hypothetical protein
MCKCGATQEVTTPNTLAGHHFPIFSSALGKRWAGTARVADANTEGLGEEALC